MRRQTAAADRLVVARRDSSRPHLEQLENRLPAGVVLGLPVGLWAAVSTIALEQSCPISEIAVVTDHFPDSVQSDSPNERVTFGSSDLRLAVIDTRYGSRAEDTLALWSSLLPGEDPIDDPLQNLASLITPMAGPRDSGLILTSTNPNISLIGAPLLAPLPAGSVPAGNATGETAYGQESGHSAYGISLVSVNTSHRGVPLEATLTRAMSVPANKSQILAHYGQQPVRFEANQGQTDAQVQFISPGSASTLFLTADEAVLSLHQPATPGFGSQVASTSDGAVHMKIVGANPASRPVAEGELPGRSNYFLGSDPTQWHTHVPAYAKVEYPDIYRGINLVYYGNQQQLEYDFIVRPGADPGTIALGFGGALQLGIDAQGDLLLQTASGTVVQHKPIMYQEANGLRQQIVGSYVFKGPQQVGFQVGAYDPTRTLVIDPVLDYATYLGGSMGDVGNAIAIDAAGNVYVTGDTTSIDFPTANPRQPAYGGGTSNAFVAKLDATGSTLLYSTYLGGEGFDRGNGIALDSTGCVYVVGKTNSRMFPITPGAFEDTFRGDEFDAFVTKISPAGDQLDYSTYLGGNNNDAGIAIAVDPSGNAYVTGGTKSTDFPVTQSAYQGANNGGTNAFITEFNATGTDVIYSTFLGGSFMDRGNALAVDGNGFIYVAGQTNSDDFPTKDALRSNYGGGLNNAFVAKLNPKASGDDSLIYATFLGGSGKDRALGIAVDSSGNVYVAGEASSADFPIANALQPIHGAGTTNGFVAAIASTGTTLVFSTYLGGSGDDRASALALDANGNIYITGSTTSADFPVANPVQPNLGGGSDAFVAKMTSDGSTLVYSTYLGGSGDEDLYQNGINIGAIAVDAGGNAYVTGQTTSADFPTVNPLQPALLGSANAFIAKIADPGP